MSCLRQDAGAGGIDWGDSEATPLEIEIVDAGTECKIVLFCEVFKRTRL